MITLPIKPLSLNSAYRGRRFSTPDLNQFKRDVGRLLPKKNIPTGKLSVKYIFGVSSKNADGDNLIKVLQDTLAECYGFNDKVIYHWDVTKVDVGKGEEFISFEIKEL
jgi:Holliday junction resolvase RusA-like endonuclease